MVTKKKGRGDKRELSKEKKKDPKGVRAFKGGLGLGKSEKDVEKGKD